MVNRWLSLVFRIPSSTLDRSIRSDLVHCTGQWCLANGSLALEKSLHAERQCAQWAQLSWLHEDSLRQRTANDGHHRTTTLGNGERESQRQTTGGQQGKELAQTTAWSTIHQFLSENQVWLIEMFLSGSETREWFDFLEEFITSTKTTSNIWISLNWLVEITGIGYSPRLEIDFFWWILDYSLWKSARRVNDVGKETDSEHLTISRQWNRSVPVTVKSITNV